MANKYQRGKIYKLISPNTDKIYIGSTTEPTLACRLREHRVGHRKWQAGKYHHISSFILLNAGDCSIILLESYPCNSKDELRAREQHHIDLHADICVNMRRAHTTPEQHHEARNEHIVCECGGKYTRANWSIHTKTAGHQQYLAGGVIDASVQKRWDFDETKRALDPKNEKMVCECGGKYTRQNRSIHIKTQRHIVHFATPVLATQK
jgi:hypothetical protein